MANNSVKDWGEFMKFVSSYILSLLYFCKLNLYSLFQTELPALEDLLFVGNPLEEKHTSEGDWRKQVATRLKTLKKLDGKLHNFFGQNLVN